MCKLYHLFPDGTERLQASGEAVESTERNDVLQTKVEASRKLEWVEEVFSQNRPIQLKVLHKVYSELSYVKGEAPELFAGDRVYLWEQLAFAFNYYGQIKQVEKSLRNQAELQPAKSDAFLNLGVFLTDRGFYQEAIAVYKEGLERTPNCEFLNYNLANLARFTGQHKLAEKALNDAMLANPSWGLNLLAKAEHCLEQEQYEMAVQYLEEALPLLQEEEWWSWHQDCLHSMGLALLELNRPEQARGVLLEALALDADCGFCHELLGRCYKQLGEVWLSRVHLKRAKELADQR